MDDVLGFCVGKIYLAVCGSGVWGGASVESGFSIEVLFLFLCVLVYVRMFIVTCFTTVGVCAYFTLSPLSCCLVLHIQIQRMGHPRQVLTSN